MSKFAFNPSIPDTIPFPLKTDQYKANSHWAMLPKNILSVDSYCEPRKGAAYSEIVLHGLQANILKNLVGQVITGEGIEYTDFLLSQSNYHSDYFNKSDWYRILAKHGGKLPLRIKSLPEGTVSKPGVAWFTVEGLDDEFPWLSQRTESLLLHSWYPTTIATRSRSNLKVIQKFLKESSELDPEFARHLYVDFGYRACSCDEQAAIGGAAHGLNSYASDTSVALHEIHKYYGGVEKGTVYSLPATEHSISQSYGKREDDYLLEMMSLYPDWILSVAGDTNNIEKFVDEVVRRNKEAILSRWKNGKAEVNKLVIRPDSLRFDGDTPLKQVLWIFQKLEDIFGCQTNKKGRKVLHPCVSVLWGDGLEDMEMHELYEGISREYSVESLVVGQGGGLLVKDANRDTLRFALKASSQKIENQGWIDVVKDPLDVTKKSKAGKLKTIINNSGELETINQHDSRFFRDQDQMITVFEMGDLVEFYNYKQIRDNCK